jgi:hypothetical protein
MVAGVDWLGVLGAGVFWAAEPALLPFPQAVRLDSPITAVPTTKAMRFMRSFSSIC